MYMDEFVRCVASAGMEVERCENVITFLNVLSLHALEELTDLVKGKVQDQGCAPSF